MPKIGPIKRKDLRYFLKQLGFTGPYAGGKHEFMEKGDIQLTLPNPHQVEIGRSLLAALLREGQIERSQWEKL